MKNYFYNCKFIVDDPRKGTDSIWELIKLKFLVPVFLILAISLGLLFAKHIGVLDSTIKILLGI